MIIDPSHLFKKYFKPLCVPGTVLDVRNIAINKTEKLLHPELLHFVGEIDK